MKQIKEEKAASFLHDKLRDNIGDMIAYEKHNGERSGQGTVTSTHFQVSLSFKPTLQSW